MKKHSEALAKVTSADLSNHIEGLRKDISDLTRGVRMGDVQNYNMIQVKKKELARALTRKASEAKETK